MEQIRRIILKDNNTHIISDEPEEYLSLRNIANHPISELQDEKGNNLLIYPNSFKECEDEAGKQCVFTMQENFVENKCTKISLSLGNLAGFIGIGNLHISIKSRFTENCSLEDNSLPEDFFLHYMIQKVFSVNLFNLKHQTSDEQIFDFLLYMFPKFLNDALLQGIYKEYRRQKYNDSNVKGVIDINRHIGKNIPFNSRVAYNTREFSYDNPVTELIRHTIEYIGHLRSRKAILQNDAETIANVSKIIYSTPNYNLFQRQEIIKRNILCIHHPYFTRYASLQKLCLQILSHESLKYGNKKDEVYGILFDVAWLWEEYLATLLSTKGFKHPQNLKGTGRIHLTTDNKIPRYPDFYDYKEHGIIIDAKYKRKIDERNDINQMITYLYRLRGHYGILLQPIEKDEIIKSYSLDGYGKSDEVLLQLYYCTIPQNTISFKDFSKKMEPVEKKLLNYIYDISK